MNWSARMSRSWDLLLRSFTVIQENPKLLVFPVVTGTLSLGIALFFLAPVALVASAPSWIDGTWVQSFGQKLLSTAHHTGGHGAPTGLQSLGSVVLAGCYLGSLYLATLGSVAFSSQIFEALRGRPVSIRAGLQAALDRWLAVLLWTLLAGTVGLIIRALQERLNWVGRLIVGLAGFAWSVACTFAIPILVCNPQTRNPMDVLTSSARTIRKAWGEALTGYLGMQGLNLLIVFGSIAYWIITVLIAVALKSWILGILAGGTWLLAIYAYVYISSIASRIYLCALYLYATEDRVTGPYTADMMQHAWTRKD